MHPNFDVGAKVRDLIKDLFFKAGTFADQLVKSVSKVLHQENWSDHFELAHCISWSF